MLKRSLVAVAVVALLAMGVQAGEIKSHEWPCDYKALEIASIPVFMDIGWFIKIKDQDKLEIVLVQDTEDLHKFTGCTTMSVESNFNATFSCKASGNGTVGGDWACNFPDGATVNAGSSTVKVCATLTKANLATAVGLAGKKHIQVGTVKISVKPT
jgi:hypothetical protein